MVTPQMGIFALGTAAHCHLEFELTPGRPAADLLPTLASLDPPAAAAGGINIVIGVRPSLWRTLAPVADIPLDVDDFGEPLIGVDGYTMPATQRDVWVWLAGAHPDVIFDAAAEVVELLSGVAVVADETVGWSYRHNRDLTGFIDGTENPTLGEAPTVALVADGSPGAAASVLLLQKWVHQHRLWNGLSDEQQELVIGRTKPASVELEPDRMPPDSHVSRTSVDDAGDELEIFRRNTPYGSPSEHGTLFVGFCSEQRPLQLMLDRMAGIGDGIRDALTLYATPISGSYYVVPSAEALRTWAVNETEEP